MDDAATTTTEAVGGGDNDDDCKVLCAVALESQSKLEKVSMRKQSCRKWIGKLVLCVEIELE